MQEISVSIPPGDSESLLQIDTSFAHWSVEHAKLHLQAAEVMNNIRNLYDSRSQIIGRVFAHAHIKATDVVEVKLDPKTAKMMITLRDGAAEPIGPTGPTDSGPTGTQG